MQQKVLKNTWIRGRNIDKNILYPNDNISIKTDDKGDTVGMGYFIGGSEVSLVELVRRDTYGSIFINVATKEEHRGRGYATLLVHAATEWIIENGYVARYGAEINNVASIAIARRLKYKLTSQHIVC